MKTKFINWKEIAFWAYKDTDHCNKNLKEIAHDCLKDVNFQQNILTRFPKLKLAWYKFCEKLNIDSTLKEDLLGFSYDESIKFFVSCAQKSMEIDVDEGFVDQSVQNVLNSTKSPKLKACLDDMIQVQQYFNDNNNIDLTAVKLCHKMLKHTTKFETLAFLQSCFDEKEEELFYELPTELLSQMRGKPCKTTDLIEKNASPVIPHRKMIVSPSFVITTSNTFQNGKTMLYGKSGTILSAFDGGGLITVIPTNSTLEQFLISTDVFTGECKLYSSTRRSLSLLGKFELDKNSEIHWMDAYITPKKEIKLVWGATDPLRGKVIWSKYTGLNIQALLEEKELFFELSNDEEIFIHQDFSKHGNLLSLWIHTEEDENVEGRCWKTTCTIIQNTNIKIEDILSDCVCVWGNQVQYFEFYKDKIIFKELGKIKQTQSLQIDNLFCGAVLYSHSR